jgi:FAD/FMN-containing dehydrogenase
LGVVTAIEVHLMPQPEAIETYLVAFPSMEAAAQTVTDIVSAGVVPTTLEVMDRLTVQAVEAFMNAGYPQDAEAVLLIEIDGAAADLGPQGGKIEDLCRRNGGRDFRRARNEKEREKLWEGRRGAYPAMARLAPNVLVEDGVVPRTRLPEAVRRIRAIAARENLRLGLIAHAGDGNLHPNMIFDERDAEETRRVKAAGEEMLRVCVELGGSISGEHGIGTDKRNAMSWLFTPETLAFFRTLKDAVDPHHLANPGKILPEPSPSARAVLSPSAPTGSRRRVTTLAELQSLLAWAQNHRRPLRLVGGGTAECSEGDGAFVVDLTGLDQVLDLDRDNFTLTVQAGASLENLRGILAAQGRYMHLMGTGTVGGAIATNAGGGPPVRDQILGATVVLPGGAAVSLGGKVVKNVAGYDAVKLFIGSWGTLGVLSEVTLRLHVRPPEVRPGADRCPPTFNALPNAELHRRLKKAVDPLGILQPHLFSLEAVGV